MLDTIFNILTHTVQTSSSRRMLDFKTIFFSCFEMRFHHFDAIVFIKRLHTNN